MTSKRDADVIPIFPLSNVVLFPKVLVPLYIFEPRYRQMTRHALQGDKRIGMVVALPSHLHEMPGDPPIFPIGCEGVITQSQERPDGSFNIALQGSQRFVIEKELERTGDRLFRSAQVKGLEDLRPESDKPAIRLLRDQVFQHVSTLLERVTDRSMSPEQRNTFQTSDDETLVNALCQSIEFTAPEKQRLLDAESILQRFERLLELLRFRLAEELPGAQSGNQKLH